MRTEDQVRDMANEVLGLAGISPKVALSGVGQITTMKQLGFRGEGSLNKPDGWYLPVDKGAVAIVLETKATDSMSIDSPTLRAQVEKYCATVRSQYDLVVGVVYDGERTRAYVNGKPLDVPDELQTKEYYFSKLTDRPIDKNRIYELTQRINNSLHGDFGIKNLYHRMIFTACALVARRYEAVLIRGMDYSEFHNGILNALNKAIRSDIQQNSKLSLLSEVYSEIRMNVSTDEDDPRAVARLKNLIGDFIDWVTEISGLINSNAWNGEDVMAIFFNEFNRYKKKSESGQVFTPDHITGFMYRLLGVNKDDKVLDACAGSGSFLIKSMSNMIHEAGGTNTKKAKQIKANQLHGIEFDREIYALACANMLIHKDGKTNLAHMDARSESAAAWIGQAGATKVLMNPPYENKFGCMEIVENVLDNVARSTLCAFILPEKKLEKTSIGRMSRIKRNHRLLKVVKLPENLFFGVGVTTSIFIFEAGKPQGDKKIFAVNVEEDGLVTVKNQGRHDIRDKWTDLEHYWVDAIERNDDSRFSTGQWLDPAVNLSWQAPVKPFAINHEDLARTVMEYAIFRQGINARELHERLGKATLYLGEAKDSDKAVTLSLPLNASNHELDTNEWSEFLISDLFKVGKGSRLTKSDMLDGSIRHIGASQFENGITAMIANDDQIHPGNLLTVCYDGPVGTTFYQAEPFWATDAVNVLYPKFELNEARAMFLIPVVQEAGTRFDYGQKWGMNLMKATSIKLPVTESGEPDWTMMESTISTITESRMLVLEALMATPGGDCA